MTRGLAASLLALVAACGGGAVNAPPPGASDAPREPLPPAELRASWAKLTAEETEVVRAIDGMAGLPADARMKLLSRAREGAGFVVAGLTGLTPTSELAACHAMALEGAKTLRASLDGISEVWMGKVAPDRAASQKLAEGICQGAGRLAAGRTSCGVTTAVPTPVACSP